jgi:hypothetical protein
MTSMQELLDPGRNNDKPQTVLAHGLTDECIAFARDKGYRKLMLWTNGHLDAARVIYRSRNFKLVKSEPMQAHGQDLVSEIWELKLSTQP